MKLLVTYFSPFLCVTTLHSNILLILLFLDTLDIHFFTAKKKVKGKKGYINIVMKYAFLEAFYACSYQGI